MAVAFDAATESARTGTTDPHTFTHTPTGTPRGVILTAVNGNASTDFITSVTYGGVAMGEVLQATDTVTEPGNAQIWFLGSSIPTGQQTVSIDLTSATTTDIHFVCITVTASADTYVHTSGRVQENAANPSVTLDPGARTSMAFAALYGGGASPASFTPNGNCTAVHDHDLGAFYSSVIRQTTAASGSFAIGGTAASDDVAFVACTVTEKASPTVSPTAGPATAAPGTPEGIDIHVGPQRSAATAGSIAPGVTTEDGGTIDATVSHGAATANADPATPDGLDVTLGPSAATSEAEVVAPGVTAEAGSQDATVSHGAGSAEAESTAPSLGVSISPSAAGADAGSTAALLELAVPILVSEATADGISPLPELTVTAVARATASGRTPDDIGEPGGVTQAPTRSLLGVGA